MSIQTGIDGLQGIAAIAGVTGALRGIISPDIDVWDPVSGAEIVAEPVSRAESPVPSVLGRRGVQQVTHDVVQQAARQKGAVSGWTDAHGRFAMATRERPEGWRVFACFSEIHPAGAAKGASIGREVCFDLGVFPSEKPIDAVIPEALYCTLKKLADQWTVCGRVTECASGQAVSGAVVTARDVDVVQDDLLGSAPTNSSGVYRIDYPGSTFRLGTILDIELFGGPDIYFGVSDSGGHVLFQEPASAGRAPTRRDRDCCARIDLCATVGAPAGGGTTFADAWSSIGIFYLPDGSPDRFDATGYMGANRWALAGTPMLKGQVDLQVGGRPVEYRFLVSSAATDNGAAPPADADFDRVVGEGAGATLFAAAEIGSMIRLSPSLRIVPIDARPGDLRPGGWLRVQDCIDRVFGSTPGLSAADIPSFTWQPGGLMALATGGLSTTPNVPGNAAAPGQTIPPADHIAAERFAIRFQIRTANPADPTDVAPLPGDGITLNSVVVNNNGIYLSAAVLDGSTTVSCEPAHGAVSVAYTAYHPELSQVSVNVHDNLDVVALDDTPFTGNTDPTVTEYANAAEPVAGLHRCGYLATFQAWSRQHDGTQPVGYAIVQKTFYYDPTP